MRIPVVFRRFREGDLVALFPTIPADNSGRYCDSFQHIGQHGGADYSGLIAETAPAHISECVALIRELTSAPYHYDLRVIKRATAKMHTERVNQS